MCMCTMESILDARDGNDIQPAEDVDWLNKYVETENIFLDYLRSITFASLNGQLSTEAVLPQYDGSESGLEALDHLCDLLVTLCDGNGHQNDEGFSNAFSSDGERKKHMPRSKRSLRCLSSHYGKELQVDILHYRLCFHFCGWWRLGRYIQPYTLFVKLTFLNLETIWARKIENFTQQSLVAGLQAHGKLWAGKFSKIFYKNVFPMIFAKCEKNLDLFLKKWRIYKHLLDRFLLGI